MDELRSWMFENVYLGETARAEHGRIEQVLTTLFNYYADHPEKIPDRGGAPDSSLDRRVTDYLAGMTDRYCIRIFEQLTVPESFAA